MLMANSHERGPYNLVPKTKDSLALLLSQPNTRWYESKMRMSMQCFDYLVQLLSTDEVFVRKPTGRPQRAVREQVAIFLQYMGDPSTKLGSAVNTGIGEGSIYHYVDRVADALYHLLPQVIRWPTGAEAARVADAFEVDNCVGVIDGTLLPLATAPPLRQRMSYFNGRKKMYCATVDDKKRFTSIWRWRDVYFPDDTFILGDKGYPQSALLITSFNQIKLNAMGPLSQRKAIVFNKTFSSKQIVVEQVFGDLKNKFRWLKLLAGVYHTPMWKYVGALMVLHNLLIDWRDEDGPMVEWELGGRQGEPPFIRPLTPEDEAFIRERARRPIGQMAVRPDDAAKGKRLQERVKRAFESNA
ncbi:BZ3500_MvSof-1268-A1-R1_Chr7-3g09566 [Microbotryum saponariae]|uniref:BZ3500_MvSof-1268-A1-R1_Chr7-3g09566 protein n=1 Tax=Microbotryum saponariae TaxID=289078 RepID=A0A2X0MZJ5_9BASI|nr:BZ3501_MvSof-1269-A2-R1_Chr7-2g09289 [Microbotryum saponariae]SDA02215.1 BZ3500_MvSof-1268-A1-R1_Chr7-3g09566 [Microbotryum saponariae]